MRGKTRRNYEASPIYTASIREAGGLQQQGGNKKNNRNRKMDYNGKKGIERGISCWITRFRQRSGRRENSVDAGFANQMRRFLCILQLVGEAESSDRTV
jgi:hypothetical protein